MPKTLAFKAWIKENKASTENKQTIKYLITFVSSGRTTKVMFYKQKN